VNQKYLRRTIVYYLAAGLTMNAALLGHIVLRDYQSNLEDVLARFSGVTINIVKIKNAIRDMDHVMGVMDGLYPYGESLERRDALLHTADKIKSMVRGGTMTLKEVSVQGNELIMPLEITLVTRNYADVVNVVGSMQSLAFPYSVLEHLDIRSEEGRELRCSIKAHLRMPASAAGTDEAPPSL